MKYRNIAILLMATFTISLSSCDAQTGKKGAKNSPKAFTIPEFPALVTEPTDRANFLAEHYFDNFDFADTTLTLKPEFSEQLYVDYISILPMASPTSVSKGANTLLNNAMAGDTIMYAYFTELAEKYLFDPNSPMRNEELYIPVLRHIVGSPKVGELDKVRPRYLLEIALKNRVGDVALDFNYTDGNGKNHRMSGLKTDFTLLFFNNPGCGDCRRVKEFITRSILFNSYMYRTNSSKKTLTILSIYPDTDLENWKKESYPEKWTNGYIPNDELRRDRLYDLKAIPTFYLLDREKRVILKDATIESIEEWLKKIPVN